MIARSSQAVLAATALLCLGACGTAAEPSSRTERAGVAAAALTNANQICADWSPYTEKVDWYCESTQDVGHVYTQARAKAGGQVGTISLWVLWPIDEGQEDDPAKLKEWSNQVGRVMTWLEGQSDLELFKRSLSAMGDGESRLIASQTPVPSENWRSRCPGGTS